MSTLKTATSALTAAVLVTGIGLAWAQTEDQPQSQPTEPMAAATAAPTSEQTPADPNALPPTDSTMQQQTPPADEPARTTPPVDNATTAPLPSDSRSSTTDSNYNSTTPATPATTPEPSTSYTPAPRADRN